MQPKNADRRPIPEAEFRKLQASVHQPITWADIAKSVPARCFALMAILALIAGAMAALNP